jgi:superfamily II DNA/RNA helicase
MADLGFLPSVRRILDATPSGGQRLLFSATLDNEVDVLVRTYLQSPATHSVPDDQAVLVPIDHHVLTVHATDKAQVVRELASGQQRALLFTRTKHGARKLAGDLSAAGIPSVDLHGNLSQAVRDRNLTAFRDGDVRVLVATDIAARGIHVDDVGLVVHVDPPAEHKAFTHRSGRTARAGATGVVVTLQTPAQDRDVAVMTRKAGIHPQRVTVRPGAHHVRRLVGPPADLVYAVEDVSQTTSPQRPNGPGRRGRRHARGRRPRTT